MSLSTQAKALLKVLVDKLPSVQAGNPATYTSYRECHRDLALPMQGRDWGHSLQLQGLNDLATWQLNTGVPAITGLIINQLNLMPGEGFFRLYGVQDNPFEWWKTQIELCQGYNWQQHLDAA
ncbi:hypothetical protein [Paraferrimonas sp. SM1919]|uniref:hypothetical protein n=1 Tax=Paraferrimonas sp. SM1919 TaxID=2662263 RepID=UPI0013D8D41E|nr:hypothetical protein [Paraferrimonas sp. SM1919]